MQSEISNDQVNNTENYHLSQETIRLFRDVITNTARSIRPEGADDYVQWGLLLQQLNEAERALSASTSDLTVAENSQLSL